MHLAYPVVWPHFNGDVNRWSRVALVVGSCSGEIRTPFIPPTTRSVIGRVRRSLMACWTFPVKKYSW
jgi:hypothetical protein